MGRTKFRICAGVMASAIAVLTLVGPASAEAAAASYSLTGNTLSTFNPIGEHLVTQDRAKDDHSSVTLLRLDSTSSNSIQYWNYHGVGTRTDADLDLAEGRVVYIKSCEGEWHGSVGASDVLESTCDTVWRKGIA